MTILIENDWLARLSFFASFFVTARDRQARLSVVLRFSVHVRCGALVAAARVQPRRACV